MNFSVRWKGATKVAWSYERLWILLIKRKMKKTDLIDKAGVTSNTIAHMSKDEEISLRAIGKICKALSCRVEDIIEWIPEGESDIKKED